MKDKLNTLRTLPEDKALAIFERYMREQWDEGFQAGIKTTVSTQELVYKAFSDKEKSIATLQKEAMNAGASNLPAGFTE